jgi:hypothetical protein
MRGFFGAVVLLALGVGACGLISGLSGYGASNGTTDGSLSSPTPEDASLLDRSRQNADASVPSGDAGDMTRQDEGTSEGADTSPGETAPDSAANDASDVADVGNAPDVALDALPDCGPSNCSNCCSNGMCVGGRSVTTCGAGGATCTDCTSKGGACGSNGACTTPAPDAAPPPACDANKCGGCDGFYEIGCCKSDQTCGCRIYWVPGSSCN